MYRSIYWNTNLEDVEEDYPVLISLKRRYPDVEEVSLYVTVAKYRDGRWELLLGEDYGFILSDDPVAWAYCPAKYETEIIEE